MSLVTELFFSILSHEHFPHNVVIKVGIYLSVIVTIFTKILHWLEQSLSASKFPPGFLFVSFFLVLYCGFQNKTVTCNFAHFFTLA